MIEINTTGLTNEQIGEIHMKALELSREQGISYFLAVQQLVSEVRGKKAG